MKIYIYFKNTSQEFWLKNIDQTRSYFLIEIEQSELMSQKHEIFCTIINYIENFFISISAITGWILISAFAFLLDILIGITSSARGLKTCRIATGITKYKPIISKKEKQVYQNSIVIKN